MERFYGRLHLNLSQMIFMELDFEADESRMNEKLGITMVNCN